MRPRWLPGATASYLVPLCLFAFAALLYANSLSNGFVLDDRALVERNPLIRRLERIPTLFTSDYWSPRLNSGLYRPVVMTTYALNFAVGKRDPRGYHGVNIGLHALVSVLVWALYRRLSGDALTAAVAAFLFAAHAIHTEAVANVVGRAELLASLFFLLALLGYLGSQGAQGQWRAGPYVASLGAYGLGLLTKESVVTLVGVIFLYDFVYGQERARGLVSRLWAVVAARWRAYSGYVGVTLFYLGIRTLVLGSAKALPPPIMMDNPLVMLDLPWRLLNALQVTFRYLGLLFFPVHLSYDYSYNHIPMLTSLADPRALLVLGLSAALIAIVVWSYRAWKELFFALGFYCATFSPVSNLVVVIGTIMGERLAYVPSMGFCLALVLILRRLCGRLPLAPSTARAVFIGVMVLGVGLHSARTLVRNPNWESHEQLYLHDVEVVPGSAKAQNNAAALLWGKKKEHEKALEFFKRSIELAPQYYHSYRTAGFVYTELGRDKEAMEMYELSMRYGGGGARVYNNLGFILVDHEIEIERGVTLIEKAVEERPKNPDFLDSLAWGYYKLGRLAEARKTIRRSLRIDHTSASTPSRRAHLKVIEEALRRQEKKPAVP
jgi:tetratricopeptide (TPR) repeat protein